VAAGKISLREAQAIAYLLEHGRWPDADTGAWAESRLSGIALDYLLSARLRGTIAAQELEPDEDAPRRTDLDL
jgi:hypothetical protein